MTLRSTMAHEFVHFIPEQLTTGVLYVSTDCATAVHLCCCGCGYEVVTPLSPVGWKVVFDGVSVSLYPSIGNWNYECQSHYWIRGGRVIEAGSWSREKVEREQARERREHSAYMEALGDTERAPVQVPASRRWWALRRRTK